MGYHLNLLHIFTVYLFLITTKKMSASGRTFTNLVSVFNSFHLTSLYEGARKRAPYLYSHSVPNTDIISKDKICLNVISSDYFFFKSYKPVRMEDIYIELLDEQYEHIHNDIFQKSTNDKLKSLFSTEDNYIYVNPYLLINQDTVIHEAGQSEFRVDREHVFTCIARYNETGELVVLYISREYNTAGMNSNQYIAGRFIFEGDGKGKLRLLALAEQPASIFYGLHNEQVALERSYIEMKKKQSIDEREYSGPLCESIDRTRLCSSILASLSLTAVYGNTLKSFTYYEPIYCFKKEVSFLTEEISKEVGKSEYYEWMIYCEAWENYEDEDYPNSVVRFFVSKGFNRNSVFIHSVVDDEDSVDFSDGETYLEHLSVHVNISA